jgi:FKBP-type peptidyl-prolyl cis-trans isomerase
MREGGRRILTIPPNQAYGRFGSGASIPPYSVLIFRVDLVEVFKNPDNSG